MGGSVVVLDIMTAPNEGGGVNKFIMVIYVLAFPMLAAEPEWNAANVRECDRACLVGIMDGYMNAIFQHDPKAVPLLAADVRMTETPAPWMSAKACYGAPKWNRPVSSFTPQTRSKAK